jgi:hypothetical protein
MKYFKIIALLFSSVIFLHACNDTAKTTKQETSKTSKALDSTAAIKAKTPTPTLLEPAQNERGVWHYTCSKGCAGGSGSAVNCDNCGGLLAHNTTYHDKANSTPASSAPFANPSAATPTAEPSQNSAGVWHYTCSKGCAGGAGAAGSCSNCGGALAHNTAYH